MRGEATNVQIWLPPALSGGLFMSSYSNWVYLVANFVISTIYQLTTENIDNY